MLRYGITRTRQGTGLVHCTVGDEYDRAAPLVLIHPINMRKEYWLGVLPELARTRRCIMIDLAGHGESHDCESYSLRGWIDDCVNVIDTLALPSFHLVGGSLGGCIAAGLAADLPSRTLSLTALGSNPSPDDPDDERRGTAFELLEESTDALFDVLSVDAVAPGSSNEVVTTVRHLTNTHGSETVRKVLQAAQIADARNIATQVRCSALVLTGEHDVTCSVDAGTEFAKLMNGSHRTLDKLGHLPAIEDAATVAAVFQSHMKTSEQELQRER